MSTTSTRTIAQYRSSVDAVDSCGYVAYEVCHLDGEYHVTRDPASCMASQSVWDTRHAAMAEAARVNRRLVASLTTSERHSYLGH